MVCFYVDTRGNRRNLGYRKSGYMHTKKEILESIKECRENIDKHYASLSAHGNLSYVAGEIRALEWVLNLQDDL